jgi:hypothetical protein
LDSWLSAFGLKMQKLRGGFDGAAAGVSDKISPLAPSSADLCQVDWHPNAAVTALIPKLSCRGCRPNAPFAELLKLSQKSIGEELRAAHTKLVLGYT